MNYGGIWGGKMMEYFTYLTILITILNIFRIFIDCKLGLILELYSTLNLLNLSRPIISPVEPVVVPVYKGWICFSFLIVWRFRILLQFRFKQQVLWFLKYKIENSFIHNSQKFGKIKKLFLIKSLPALEFPLEVLEVHSQVDLQPSLPEPSELG